MTVRQLIEVLQKVQDPDMRIMVPGYEGGFNDLETNSNNIHTMVLDVHGEDEWYFGKHEILKNMEREELITQTILKAIIF
jgi:hypothetical protein